MTRLKLKDTLGKTINKILTLLAAFALMLWAWRWFGPGGDTVRKESFESFSSGSMGLSDFIWLSIAIACLGYLLWRFMSYIFWKKYFDDETPPDDDNL